MAGEAEYDPPPALAQSGRVPPEGAGLRHPRRRRLRIVYDPPPLPSAQELARYGVAAEEAPLVIMGEFMAEGEHRRRVEMELVRGENLRAARGQWFAMVVLLAALAVGGGLVLAGHAWAGTAIASGNVVGMGAHFLRARSTRFRNRNGRGRGRLNNE